jgi:hypothetical protein
MNQRRKVFRAVSGPLVVALGTAAVTDPADNPHTEPKQHEEEPRLRDESPYSTTSVGAVVTFPWDSSLVDIPVLRHLKK